MGANSSVIPYLSVPVYDQLQTSRRPILSFHATLTLPSYDLLQTYGGRFRRSLPSYLTYFTTCSRRLRHGTGRTVAESSARRCPFSTPEQVRTAPRRMHAMHIPIPAEVQVEDCGKSRVARTHACCIYHCSL
jgi:hypothetical protein